MKTFDFKNCVIYLFFLVVLLGGETFMLSASSKIVFDIVVSVCASIFFICKKDRDSQFRKVGLRPVHFFLLSFLIVFFQRPLDYVIGLVSDKQYLIGNTSLMPMCVKYASIGLMFFFIGYYIKPDPVVSVSQQKINKSLKKAPTWFFSLMTSICLLLIVVLVPRSIRFGGYGQAFLDSAGPFNYLSSWIRVFFIAYYIQTFCNDLGTQKYEGLSIIVFIKKLGLWHLINMLFYFFMILNLGDRGPVIITLTALYIAYIMICRRRINTVFIISALLIGISFSALLGQSKEYRGNNNIFERIDETRRNNSFRGRTSIIPVTEELAISYTALAHAMEYVPDNIPYTYGMLQLGYALSAIPFSNSLLSKVIDLPGNSSSLVTFFIQGDNRSSGRGTSCIADFYIDGGLLFIIIGMFIWGIVVRRFEFRLISDSKLSLFIFCVAFHFLSYMFYIPRSCVMAPFKYGIWLFAIMFLYQKLAPRHI